MTAVQHASGAPQSAPPAEPRRAGPRPPRPGTRNVPPPPLAPNVRQRPGTAPTPRAPQPPHQPAAAPQALEGVTEQHAEPVETVAFLADDSTGTKKPGRTVMVAGAILLAVGLVVAMVTFAVEAPLFVLLPVGGSPVLAGLGLFGYGLINAAKYRRR